MRADKQILCRQFQRAADSYDCQAAVQQRTADRLLDLLEQHSARPPQRALEIGCGTGLLTRRLVKRVRGIQELLLNDLVPDCAARLNSGADWPKLSFLAGDIEAVALPGSFDLIISSSTFHWLHDLDRLLARLAAALNPDGTLAFSLYGPDNLREIRALTGIGLDSLSPGEIEAMLCRHLTLEHSSGRHEVLHFAAPQDVLRHLRQTGVNAVCRSVWTRGRLRQFCCEYSRRFSVGRHGVRLTYHPLCFVARN